MHCTLKDEGIFGQYHIDELGKEVNVVQVESYWMVPGSSGEMGKEKKGAFDIMLPLVRVRGMRRIPLPSLLTQLLNTLFNRNESAKKDIE
jgi:hypothetical protein